jgi:hypothetical protein
MDEDTQHNAALVEQTAAVAESLQEHAGNLAEVVSVFTLDQAPAARAPTVKPASPVRALAAPTRDRNPKAVEVRAA